MLTWEGLGSGLIFNQNTKFHLEEKIVMHLRFDILVMCLSSVILYLELGQPIGSQQVHQSVGSLASLPVQFSALQVDVKEPPEVVDLLRDNVERQCSTFSQCLNMSQQC